MNKINKIKYPQILYTKPQIFFIKICKYKNCNSMRNIPITKKLGFH